MNKDLINPNDYRTIQEHLDGGRKIGAIKHLRNVAKLGLKEAKLAVERLAGQSVPHDGLHLVMAPLIMRVVVDLGEGEVTFDLETMELLILKDVERLGLESCGQMLDFVHTLKAWSEGYPIGVVKPDEDG